MVVILLIYLASSIIYTYPLITNLGSYLPGQPNDAYVYLWNIYNFWHQLQNGLNPFFTTSVMYPTGANLFFHTYAPFISLLAFPFLNDLSYFLGILILISVTLSGLFAYLLLFKITKSKIGSIVGGLAYSLSPIAGSFIESQHYYFLFSSVFYPLGILFLINYFEKNKKIFFTYSLLLFWVVLSIDYYSAVIYSLLIFIFILTYDKLSFKKISNYFLMGVLILVLPFILIYKNEKHFNQFVNYNQVHNTSSSCNANLSEFVTPSDKNPFLKKSGDLIRKINNLEINLDTPSYFLGWGIFILSIFSIFKNYKSKYIKTFSIIFLTFFVLSLGTSVKFGSSTILEGAYTPFYYFLKIPILNSIDCPIRFPIILSLCISVFMSLFISYKSKTKIVALGVFLLIVIEYGNININFSQTKIPSIYRYLSSQQDQKTVLEIPSGITESKSAFGYDWSIQALHSQQMYWQSEHQKPRVGVYMSRLTDEKYNFFRSEPVISEIFSYSSIGGVIPSTIFTDKQIEEFIRKFNLGFIVLSPNIRQEEFSLYIEKLFKKYIVEKINSENYILYKLSLTQL